MRAALLLAFLMALSPAAGQAHDHGATAGAGYRIVPDGPAFAGVLAGFSVLTLGNDDAPDFHTQNHLRVVQGETVLFETTPDSGHDYDGVARFALAFPQPGPYRVESVGEDGSVQAHYEGVAGPAPTKAATVVLEGTTALAYHAAVEGAPVPSRVLLELTQGDRLLLRAATVATAHETTLGFDAPGTYRLRLVALPLDGGFLPAVLEQDLEIGQPTLPGMPEPRAPDMAGNAVVRSADNALLGTYDPWTAVGFDTRERLAAIGPEGAYSATLTDALGRVLFSTTQMQGPVAEITATRPPGTYTLRVSAGSSSIEQPWTVLPPSDPSSAGPQALTLAPVQATGGAPFDLGLSARDARGAPFQHAEVDLRLTRDGVPTLEAKLHTHDDGDFPVRLALPAGPASLSAQAFPLEPRATTGTAAYATLLDVAPGDFPAPAAASAPDGEAAPLGLLPLAVALLAVAARRRPAP